MLRQLDQQKLAVAKQIQTEVSWAQGAATAKEAKPVGAKGSTVMNHETGFSTSLSVKGRATLAAN